MNKLLLIITFTLYVSIALGEGTKVYPAHWMMGRDVSQYTSPYTGNLCLPPYYLEYIDEGDYRAQKCWIVYGITGSFHDGTWVQARRRDITRSLHHDGPFKDADIDTLFLPHTISEIGDGAFENGKIKVLVIGAQTPPKFNTGDNTPALGAKLIVPTGCLDAYKTHEAWSKFPQIAEGAEGYFPAQMVLVDGAWYELYQGEGKLICSEDVSGKLTVPDNIEFYSVNYPVTELGESSVWKYSIKTLILGSNIKTLSPRCATSISEQIDWYGPRDAALDSIFISDTNPYLSSLGGAVFTKDYQELIMLPQERPERSGSRYEHRFYSLPTETVLIRDNAFSVKTNHDNFMVDMTLFLPHKDITVGQMSSKSSVSLVYIQNWVPNTFSDEQLPIFNFDWSAYWMPNGMYYDLQYMNNDAEDEIIFPTKLSYGPMTGTVRTIGKNGNYGDYMLANFGFTKGFTTTKSFIQFESRTAKKAQIPEGVEEIYGALKNFEQLTEVSLPSTLRVLGDESFYSCRALSSITIPSSVNVIGTDAFWACNQLNDIYVKCSTPPSFHDRSNRIADNDIAFVNVFRSIPKDATLHVPSSCKQAYMDSPVWNEFTNIVDDVQTGISDICNESNRRSVSIWSIDGQKGRKRGLNIIRYDDGTVRKVITK